MQEISKYKQVFPIFMKENWKAIQNNGESSATKDLDEELIASKQTQS